MRTAVQIRPPGNGIRAKLLWGTPESVVGGRRGPVALFREGEVVAYIVTTSVPHLFIFRTLLVDDRHAAKVPGVLPHVRLLIDLSTAGRLRLMQRLFAYLVASGRNPSQLRDEFYFRLGTVLAGRLPESKVLLTLLQQSQGERPWT